jgi:hypothetical protein
VFDQVGDMPLHPLVIHIPVIGIPLALLLTLLFAFPRTRAWARWPLALTVVGSAVTTWVSMQSGQALAASIGITAGNPVGDLIGRHSQLATQLVAIMIAFSVITLANVFLVTSVRSADGTVTAARPATPVRLLLLGLLLAAAVVAFIWVARVGDLGARAVWNPTGAGLFPF